MGLDQYLYKMNRASKDEKELQKNKKYCNIGCETNMNIIQKYISSGDKIECVKSLYAHDTYDSYMAGQASQDSFVKYIDANIESMKKAVIEYMKEHSQGTIEEIPSKTEIKYWRKHYPLQDYMEDLYRKHGGTEEFNCVDVVLSREECKEVLEFAKEQYDEIDGYMNDEINGYMNDYDLDDSEAAWNLKKWEKTIEIFKIILDTVDFDKNTIYYSSWW